MVAEVARSLQGGINHPGRWQAARAVLSMTGTLTDAQLDAEVARRKDKFRRAGERAREAAEASADAAVAYVTAYRADHGVGPTWCELSKAMKWRGATRRISIEHLAKLGVLIFTQEPRSLAAASRPHK